MKTISVHTRKKGVSKFYGLDETVNRTMWSWPGGVKQERVETFRFVDYFHSIYLDDSGKVTFNVKDGVTSDWKFLAVRIMTALEDEYQSEKPTD